MNAYSEFAPQTGIQPLSKAQKAAAVLIAMGKPVAGKLLKFFAASELQVIIANAQSLRAVPAHELEDIVNEFEDLFTEGAGLLDNAKAMEGILEEGLTPDEVDGLLGRKAPLSPQQVTVWERMQETDARKVAAFLAEENAQTIAYVLSMLPSAYAAKVLIEMSEDRRADIVHRTVNMKPVNPKVSQIIESRLKVFTQRLETERDGTGPKKAADLINELDKPEVEAILGALGTISETAVRKVRAKVFLFDDIANMSQRSRATLLDGISGDLITSALRGADAQIKEVILSSIGARQRRMIESDLSQPDPMASAREIAVARRSIAQEAIRLAAIDKIQLVDDAAEAQAA